MTIKHGTSLDTYEFITITLNHCYLPNKPLVLEFSVGARALAVEEACCISSLILIDTISQQLRRKESYLFY